MTVVKKQRRARLIPVVLGMVVALAMPLSVAAPANAAPSHCPSGNACIWRDHTYQTNGSGTALVKFQRYIPRYSTWQYAGTSINANNNALSAYNNGNSERVRFYNGNGGGGSYFQLAIKTGDGNISNSSGYIQNRSWRPSSGYFASFWHLTG